MLRLVLDRLGAGNAISTSSDYYACPCCLTAYPREAVAAGILTEEHVPPARLGGPGLLLTCKDCNSNSGTSFDSHAVARSHADDFVRGCVNGRALPVTAHADGIPLRGTAQWTGLRHWFLPLKEVVDEVVAASVEVARLDRRGDRLEAHERSL